MSKIENTFEKIKSLIVDQLHLDPDKITMESEFITDLGCDSLDVVEMLMNLEQTYEISIPDEKAQDFKTVGDVVRYLENL